MEGSAFDPVAAEELGSRLSANVRRAVKVDDEVLTTLLVALLAEGHVLIEDRPGVGKTALARALARSLDAEFSRIQCTADLLPADVMGTTVWASHESRFEFHPGPVFANVVLVDEINRTSPKTQSGLLECMQERSVTADGESHELARPFIVLATQNPAEYEGTYPLPEAQLDRFMVSASLGYPGAAEEAEMLDVHGERDFVLELEPVADIGDVLAAQSLVHSVHGSEALRRYVVSVGAATRGHPDVDIGASPRANLMLFRAAKALAALRGRDHVLPDDVQELAPRVLAHRLILGPGVDESDRRRVVREASRSSRRCRAERAMPDADRVSARPRAARVRGAVRVAVPVSGRRRARPAPPCSGERLGLAGEPAAPGRAAPAGGAADRGPRLSARARGLRGRRAAAGRRADRSPARASPLRSARAAARWRGRSASPAGAAIRSARPRL